METSRQEVIAACMEQQRHIADVARQEMDSCQQQSNDYGANVDRYDSYRTKLMRQRDMYARQLAGALAAMRALDELQRMPSPEVAGHGAIVITDRGRFFLSIGAGKFMVGATPYFAISAQSPAYLAISGKRVGESFVVGGLSQKILRIF